MTRILLALAILIVVGGALKYHSLFEEFQNQTETIARQDSEIEQMKRQIQDLKSRDQSAVTGENAEIARLQQEIEQRTVLLDQTSARLVQVENAPDKTTALLQTDLKREKETIANFQNQLKVILQEKNELDLSVRQSDSDQKNVLKTRNSEIDAQIKQQQQTLKDLNSQLAQQKKIRNSLDAQDSVRQLTQQIEDGRKFVGRLQEEKNEMNLQASAQRGDGAVHVQAQQNDLKEAEQDLRGRIGTENLAAADIAKKLQQGRLSETDRQKSLHDLNADLQSQKAQIAELQNELKVHQDHVKTLAP